MDDGTACGQVAPRTSLGARRNSEPLLGQSVSSLPSPREDEWEDFLAQNSGGGRSRSNSVHSPQVLENRPHFKSTFLPTVKRRKSICGRRPSLPPIMEFDQSQDLKTKVVS
jgi:hypothetical protein